METPPCDTSKLTRFGVASPQFLPAIGVDLERRARRYLSSGRLGFLLVTLHALRALVASCSSSADASTLALFEGHVVAVVEVCILHPQIRVRTAALRLCAQFIEGQDFMASQARLEVFLSPILQGCKTDAGDDALRTAAFGALKLLLVKADVQGLEVFVPVVIPALLELLLLRGPFSGSGDPTVTALCGDCLSAITGALNAATAGFIYAPVLRFLDVRAWQVRFGLTCRTGDALFLAENTVSS